jgi:hypothetical protein
MPSTHLQITAADVKRRLNPLNEAGLFDFGDGTGIAESDLDEIIAEQEDVLISCVPEQYAVIARGTVEGEILCKEAVGGELTLQCSLFPVVTDTLHLYRDYGWQSIDGVFPLINPNRRPYSDRKVADRLESDEFSVNVTTGAVTLATALTAGQSVHADYQHTATYKSKLLRHICLVLVSAEIYETFPSFAPEEGAAVRIREEAQAKINALYASDGRASGVQLFDKMKLEGETRRDERKALKIPLLGGL